MYFCTITSLIRTSKEYEVSALQVVYLLQLCRAQLGGGFLGMLIRAHRPLHKWSSCKGLLGAVIHLQVYSYWLMERR